MSIIKNLIHKKLSLTQKQPTALCCFYDGKFDSQLAELGIKLIGCHNSSVYTWSPEIKSSNITLINDNEINNYVYDFVICNDIIKQKDRLINYTRGLHLPGIIINHEPLHETKYHLTKRLQEARVEMISTEFNTIEGIRYGTEELPNIIKDIPILLEGNFQNQDHGLIQMLKTTFPDLVLLGTNPGLSYSVQPTSFTEYRQYFARCKIFINLPTQRNISHQLLWAMSNGALIISLKTPAIEEILNVNNGILCNNPNELKNTIQQCINKETNKNTEAKKINDILPLNDFNTKWQSIINTYIKKVYIYE